MSAGGGQYELNLTPYIDLMSTLIVFLLMTVVWNQIAVLSTDGTVSSASDTAADAKDKVHLAVTIMPGYTELAENQTFTRIPHADGKIDRLKFAEILKQWKTKYPTRTDVVLNTENSVSYRMLVSAFDVLVGENFPDVGVSTQ